MQKNKLNIRGIWKWINTSQSEEEIKLREASDKIIQHRSRLDIERARSSREKYRVKKIGLWGCLPGVLSLVVLGWIIYAFLFRKSGFGGETIALLALVGVCWFAIIISGEIDAEWEDTLECKRELASKISDYKWGPDEYPEEYISIDSRWGHLKYQAARVVAQGISIVAMLVIALLVIEIFPQKEPHGSATECVVWLVILGVAFSSLYLNSAVTLLLVNVKDQEANRRKWGLKFRGINYQLAVDKKQILIAYSVACVLIVNYHGWPFSFWQLFVGAVFMVYYIVQSHKAEQGALKEINNAGAPEDIN